MHLENEMLVLANGCEIIRGHCVEVGMMQTEHSDKSEAWLYWMSGQSLTSEYMWQSQTKDEAIAHINVWLSHIGLALQNNQIVERVYAWY